MDLFCVANRSSCLFRAVQVSHVLNCISACWILSITGRNSLTMMVLVYFVTQSCPTLCDAMGCSPPGSSVHGILQARILEWLPCCPQRGSFQPRIEPRSPTLQADSLPSQPPRFVYLSFCRSVNFCFYMLTLCCSCIWFSTFMSSWRIESCILHSVPYAWWFSLGWSRLCLKLT